MSVIFGKEVSTKFEFKDIAYKRKDTITENEEKTMCTSNNKTTNPDYPKWEGQEWINLPYYPHLSPNYDLINQKLDEIKDIITKEKAGVDKPVEINLGQPLNVIIGGKEYSITPMYMESNGYEITITLKTI